MQKMCCGDFWMNDPSIDHSRQHRLPKSKHDFNGELPSAFLKSDFQKYFSRNTPPTVRFDEKM